MRLSRQNVLLLVLVVLLGVLAWQQLRPAPTQVVAPPSTRTPAGTPARASSRPRTRTVAPASGTATAPTVQLAALTAERDTPDESGRNPFRFGRAVPTAGPTPVAPPPPREPAPAPEPATPSMPLFGGTSPAPARAPASPITLKFIGLVQRGDGVNLAVLSPGEGKGPLYGREGDIIEGRYRIVRIGSESMDIEYADGRGRQTLKLSGQ